MIAEPGGDPRDVPLRIYGQGVHVRRAWHQPQRSGGRIGRVQLLGVAARDVGIRGSVNQQDRDVRGAHGRQGRRQAQIHTVAQAGVEIAGLDDGPQ
jgi:hypothetical protein